MYLGMLGFYDKFIKEYARIANPLYGLLKEKVKFEFGKEEIKAFKKLKTEIKRATNLHFFQPGRGILKLKRDASNLALSLY